MIIWQPHEFYVAPSMYFLRHRHVEKNDIPLGTSLERLRNVFLPMRRRARFCERYALPPTIIKYTFTDFARNQKTRKHNPTEKSTRR